MTDITKHIDNKELVIELGETNNPTWSPEELKRKNDLKDEILRRLNEPWRRQRDCVLREDHEQKINKLVKEILSELNNINYQQSIRHQINNIKTKIRGAYYE